MSAAPPMIDGPMTDNVRFRAYSGTSGRIAIATPRLLQQPARPASSHVALAPLELRSAPAEFWPDVFVKRSLPWSRFLQSAVYHLLAGDDSRRTRSPIRHAAADRREADVRSLASDLLPSFRLPTTTRHPNRAVCTARRRPIQTSQSSPSFQFRAKRIILCRRSSLPRASD